MRAGGTWGSAGIGFRKTFRCFKNTARTYLSGKKWLAIDIAGLCLSGIRIRFPKAQKDGSGRGENSADPSRQPLWEILETVLSRRREGEERSHTAFGRWLRPCERVHRGTGAEPGELLRVIRMLSLEAVFSAVLMLADDSVTVFPGAICARPSTEMRSFSRILS